jgi:hypothetical protein
MKAKIVKINERDRVISVQDQAGNQKELSLADWIKLEYVNLGDAEITIQNDEVTFITMEKKEKKEKFDKSKSWAEDMTNFEDLLTSAHAKGLISINTEMITFDMEKKQAIFKATVKGKIGKEIGEFTGYGDAEGITNDLIKPHFIRMAETRSIVRALRFYTNNAAVAEEETN